MKQASDFNENADRFYEVEYNEKIIIVCDKHTRVMYAQTYVPYGGEILITSMTVLVDADGKPLLYEGGAMKTRENELHEPILEEVKEERIVVEHYWRIKCPNCSETLCGSSWRDGLEEEIPNYCPTCGVRLKEA